jgi:uncharacterized protein (UPF0332 family)
VSDQRSDLITLRLDQARQALRSAKILLDSDDTQGAVNRSYYAMFYAVSALLETRRLGTSKHSGAISLFDREFVKAGAFDKRFSKSLHRAFNLRQESDYRPEKSVSYESALNQQEDAVEFVEALWQYLSPRLSE